MPLPPGHPSAGHSDRREQFAHSAGGAQNETEAERAFLKSKIELIRHVLHLNDEEKERAISELQSRLDALADEET